MTIDWTITVGNILSFIGLLLTLIVTIAGVWWRMMLRIDAVGTAAKAEAEELRRQAEKNRAEAARGLDAFKLDVAKGYAPTEMLREVEERVVDAINRLGDRLDKFFDRTATRRRSTSD